jgi:hypothetical protein
MSNPLLRCVEFILIAISSWVGVAKGAVLRGIGIGMSKAPTIKSCLRHYGICVTHRYEEWRHDAAEVTQDTYRGVRVVRDQLLWLVKQGDAILPAQPIYKTIQIEADFTQQQLDQGSTISLVFAATNVPIPPSNLRDLPRGQSLIFQSHVPLSTIAFTSSKAISCRVTISTLI